MSIYAVLDIETVENSRAQHYFTKEKRYYPAKTLKDPKKIEQNLLDQRQKDLDKAALHWWTGRIICVCINFLGAEITPKTFYGDDEKELLCQVFDCLETLRLTEPKKITIIGKDADKFDIPYFIGRAMTHDIGIPEILRPYRPISDINHIFGFSTQDGQRSTLNDYAMGLGIEQKSGHGSQVASMYLEVQMGDPKAWEKIFTYCAQDADITTEILRRYLKKYQVRDLPLTKTEPSIIEQAKMLDDIPF